MKKLLCTLLVVATMLCLVACSGAGSAEKVGEKFVKACQDKDAEAVVKLIHKDEFEYLIDDEDDWDDKDDAIEELQDEMDDYDDTFKKAKKADKDVKKEIEEWYEDELDLEVKDVMELVFESSYERYGEEVEYEYSNYAVKIGGRWYLSIVFG